MTEVQKQIRMQTLAGAVRNAIGVRLPWLYRDLTGCAALNQYLRVAMETNNEAALTVEGCLVAVLTETWNAKTELEARFVEYVATTARPEVRK